MKRLRVAFVLFVLTVLAIALSLFVLLTVLLQQSIAQVQFVKVAGDRRLVANSMAYNVHWMTLMSADIVSNEQFEDAKSELLSLADDLNRIDQVLYTDKVAFSDSQRALLLGAEVEMHEWIDGDDRVTKEHLWDVDLLLVEHTRRLASHDLVTFIDDTQVRLYLFLQDNAHSTKRSIGLDRAFSSCFGTRSGTSRRVCTSRPPTSNMRRRRR